MPRAMQCPTAATLVEQTNMTQQSRILNTAQLLNLLGIGRTALYTTLIKSQNFPKPFKIGLRNNAWFRADVEAWIDQRAAGFAA